MYRPVGLDECKDYRLRNFDAQNRANSNADARHKPKTVMPNLASILQEFVVALNVFARPE
jgi:hypothetical protein